MVHLTERRPQQTRRVHTAEYRGKIYFCHTLVRVNTIWFNNNNINWCSPFPTVTDHHITKTPRLQNPYKLPLQCGSCLDMTKQNYWIRNWSVFTIAWYVTVPTKSKRWYALPVSCLTLKKTNKTNTDALRYKTTVHKNTVSIRLPSTVPT